MKYLSMMTGLVALSASSLFAQEAADDAPAVTTTPAEVIAPIVATTPEQAKPSPEFRSYVRLLLINVMTEFTINNEFLTSLAETTNEYNAEAQARGNLLLAKVAIKALNSTESSALSGEEKALVDEITQSLPKFYAKCESMRMNDKEAGDSFEEQILIPMTQLLQKYPSVTACLDGLDCANNFVDIEKLMKVMDAAKDNANDNLNKDEKIQYTIKTYAQMAEMIRNNEI